MFIYLSFAGSFLQRNLKMVNFSPFRCGQISAGGQTRLCSYQAAANVRCFLIRCGSSFGNFSIKGNFAIIFPLTIYCLFFCSILIKSVVRSFTNFFFCIKENFLVQQNCILFCWILYSYQEFRLHLCQVFKELLATTCVVAYRPYTLFSVTRRSRSDESHLLTELITKR